jgi:hypothetical protein
MMAMHPSGHDRETELMCDVRRFGAFGGGVANASQSVASLRRAPTGDSSRKWFLRTMTCASSPWARCSRQGSENVHGYD